MLLPEPVFVMLITGDVVKNLQTPMMVALTVTETLSLACAAVDVTMAATAAASTQALSLRVLINVPFPGRFENGRRPRKTLSALDARNRPSAHGQL
jgi:hypothetical protein